jgi:glycosyltransferase involved in cell wall biosynthesis
VIVIDDGSADGTAEIAEGRSGVAVHRARHDGPAAARNLGVGHSRAPLLAFTDADCSPPPDWLAAGVTALGEFDLVQGTVAPDPAAPLGPFDHTVWVVRESGLYETASLFVRRDAFDRAGGFTDPLGARLGKQLAEDVWLGWRIRRAGGATTFIDEPVVRHAVLPRSPLRFVADRFRQWYFPAIVRLVPELRRTLFFGRVFLSARTAAFDLALAGAVLAVTLGAYLPLVLAAPYAAFHLRRTRGRGLRAPYVAVVEALADLVGLAGLIAGSARARRLVL